MNEKNNILKAAWAMSLVTSLSRVLGYARDALNAALFGAGPVSDAFFVAYRVPNMLRELFAEGALSSAFVPALARAAREDDGKAWRLAALMLNAMLMVMAAVVGLGIFLAPELVDLLAPGFAGNAGQRDLAVLLTRVLFPFIAFMSAGALLMGTLNARGRFTLPAFAPVAMNLVMIASGFWLCPAFGVEPEKQVVGWALGALLGGLAQAAVQLPLAWRLGLRAVWRWPFGDPGVRRVLSQMVPAVIGVSAVQVNILVNQNLASTLESGSISWLYYGNRMMQLPLGIFGVALATAVLPTLSRHGAENDPGAFRQTLGFGLRMTLLLTLPAAAGLVALAEPINRLLFMWGRFTASDAAAAAAATVAYGGGICFAAMVKMLAPAFYAMDDAATPVKVALGMVALNLSLSLTLMPRFQYLGLAAAVSLTAAANALLLLWFMRRRFAAAGSDGGMGLAAAAGKALVACAGMLLLLQVLGRAAAPLDQAVQHSRLVLAGVLLAKIGLAAVFYFWGLRAMGLDLLRMWRRARAGR